jgi:DNA invertase Pin-like site-specific DNA recombinase
MNAALYIRVSNDKQTVENQVAELRQLAAARGYEPVIYEEVESAAKARPVMDRMVADARSDRV